MISLSNKRSGTAIAITNMFVNLGGFIQPIIGFALIWFTPKAYYLLSQHKASDFPTQSYEYALMIVPICFIMALIMSFFWLKETHCQSQHNDTNG